MRKQIRIPEDDFTFWVDGDGIPQYRGTTRAEAARKVSEVAQMAEEWLQLHEEPPRQLTQRMEAVPTSRNVRRKQSDSIRCDYCKSLFGSESQRETHVLASHIAEDLDNSPAALAKPLVRIRGTDFERRMLKKKKRAAMPKARAIGTTGPAYPKCEKCGAPVRPNRMQGHLAARCPKRERRVVSHFTSPSTIQETSKRTLATPPRGLSGNVSGGSTGSLHVGSLGSKRLYAPTESSEIGEEYREGRRLDGSRDYWRFREDGRFGSHPSFDACDDESQP